MKELTADNVTKILKDCLYKDAELTSGQTPEGVIVGDAAVTKFGFHPGRLASHTREIAEMLLQLPKTFRESDGGGWSFLQACVREDGTQWAQHINIDELLGLGLASGLVKLCFPRNMWSSLPGGMPYFTVMKKAEEAVV